MPSEDDTHLARTIIEAYRANGIGAKIHRGGIFLERPDGWEGPLDVEGLRDTYEAEIREIVHNARAAATQCLDLMEPHLKMTIGRKELIELLDLTSKLADQGFSLHKARLYSNVVQCLLYRGEFWDESTPDND